MATGATPKSHTATIALTMIGAGLLILGVAALVMLPGLKSGAGSSEEITAVPSAVNYPAPQVKLSDLQGNPVSLSDSLWFGAINREMLEKHVTPLLEE